MGSLNHLRVLLLMMIASLLPAGAQQQTWRATQKHRCWTPCSAQGTTPAVPPCSCHAKCLCVWSLNHTLVRGKASMLWALSDTKQYSEAPTLMTMCSSAAQGNCYTGGVIVPLGGSFRSPHSTNMQKGGVWGVSVLLPSVALLTSCCRSVTVVPVCFAVQPMSGHSCLGVPWQQPWVVCPVPWLG